MHRRLAVLVAVFVLVVAAGCSSSTDEAAPGSPGSSRSSGSPGSVTTPGAGPGTAAPGTVAAPAPTVEVASEQEVEGAFRQGVAKAPDGWVFSTNLALYTTDDALVRTGADEAAIPAEWADQGFDHIGDVDVADGVVYAPLEQDDYDAGRQLMARYDLATLGYLDAVEVAQSHNAWVSVDEAGIAYSMSGFTDDTVLRYDVADGWAPLEPLSLDATVERVQGGDVRDGYLWLSTDDATDGVYRIDLRSGAVVALGSIGRVDGEAEGIDATVLGAGDLHVLTVDVALLPVRLVHLVVVDG